MTLTLGCLPSLAAISENTLHSSTLAIRGLRTAHGPHARTRTAISAKSWSSPARKNAGYFVNERAARRADGRCQLALAAHELSFFDERGELVERHAPARFVVGGRYAGGNPFMRGEQIRAAVCLAE